LLRALPLASEAQTISFHFTSTLSLSTSFRAINSTPIHTLATLELITRELLTTFYSY
jgi:hypothetical protein